MVCRSRPSRSSPCTDWRTAKVASGVSPYRAYGTHSPRPVCPSRLTSATTVRASVLAPRLIVKAPAIGQRSILADNIEDWLEVILKSGNSEPSGLPGASKYGWLGACSTRRRRGLGYFLIHKVRLHAQELAS